MRKDWRDVKSKIEDEIDLIWNNPPQELVQGFKGNFQSGAGVHGSVYGNMFYLTFESSKIGRHIVQPGISASIADDTIDVEVVKRMWQYLSAPTAKKVGGINKPNCPAPWLNLPKVTEFWDDIVNAMDSIKTKEDLRQIFYSWMNYLTFLNAWGYILFPWEHGWSKVPLQTTKPAGLELKPTAPAGPAPKDWREVKEKIENEIDKIWFEEPDEVKMARAGYFPSGAGVHGSAFGDLYFMTTDTAKVGKDVVDPAIYAALDDDLFSVEDIKKIWKSLINTGSRLLGLEYHPLCPAPWLNLPKVTEFATDIFNVYDTIKTKEDLREIYYSWANYLIGMNNWLMITFPWEYGVSKC